VPESGEGGEAVSDYEEALAELDREFPTPPIVAIRKPTWRKCIDGKYHDIHVVHSMAGSYNKCQKCGMTGERY
jgi:hypothetical protein